MSLKSECVTVETTVSYKKFSVPNFATMHLPPRPRQDGMQELPSIPLSELSNRAFVQLVEAWVDEMYRKHGQARPPEAANFCSRCDSD